MFTPLDYVNWSFEKNSVHFNGGDVFFGWGHRCIDQPRLLVVDKYYKKDRSTKRTYFVDGGISFEALEDALAALSTPPILTDKEKQLLATLSESEWFIPVKRAPYQSLFDKGIIEWMRVDKQVACRRRLS